MISICEERLKVAQSFYIEMLEVLREKSQEAGEAKYHGQSYHHQSIIKSIRNNW